MQQFEQDYCQLITKVLDQPIRATRNAHTKSFFSSDITVPSDPALFPLLNGRRIWWAGIVGELAAFLKGPKTIKDFTSQGCNYWNEWTDDQGKLSVDYGNAWLDFNGVNQLEEVVKSLKEDPSSRRHLITGWRPDRLSNLSLPCCHYSYQWYVTSEGVLEMEWIQRSVDVMIGLPSDIILAAVWNMLMAQTVGLRPGKVRLVLGDTHIYESHFSNAEKYLSQARDFSRTSANNVAGHISTQPRAILDPSATVFNFEPSMLQIENYFPMPSINFKLEV